MPDHNRLVYIENLKVLDDSGTVTIDIDVRDPIAQLEVFIQATNGATSNQGNHIHDCVSKVELVDGAEVLWGCTFVEGQAVNFYEMGKMPVFNISEWPGDGGRETVMLNFGRSLYDRELAFLADRFRNPQLKVTWDLATTTAVGATGFVSGTGRLSVIARTNPHATGAKGFLMAKGVHSWTTAASGDEVVDLPMDFPHRLLVVRSYTAGNDFRENISNLKLTYDQDKVVVFNTVPDRLSEQNAMNFGPAYEGGKIMRTNSDVVDTHINEALQVAIGARDDYEDFAMSYYWSSRFMIRMWNHSTAGFETADKKGWYQVNGQYFHNSLAWPYGDMENIAEWFDPSPYKSCKLKCTQISASAAATVVLQQLRHY